jgi:hypothetical protein
LALVPLCIFLNCSPRPEEHYNNAVMPVAMPLQQQQQMQMQMQPQVRRSPLARTTFLQRKLSRCFVQRLCGLTL